MWLIMERLQRNKRKVRSCDEVNGTSKIGGRKSALYSGEGGESCEVARMYVGSTQY